MADNILEKSNEIFLPGSPIKNRRYLVGREQEIYDLQRTLRQAGQHAIVIGDRGVGKTSLVKQVLADKEYNDVWRGCEPGLTFNLAFRDLLRYCGIDFRDSEEINETTVEGGIKGSVFVAEGSGKISEKHSEKHITSSLTDITSWDVFKALEKFSPKRFILVLDEYDAVHRSEYPHLFHRKVAYAMKHLADHNDKCDSRVVVVGVASTSAELLGKHESIQRSAREIYLRTLKREHILDFLETAENDIGIEFEFDVKMSLAYGSLGFPYYVHLVGLECVEAMVSRDRKAKKVTLSDFERANINAVEQAFRSQLSKYEAILYISDPNELAIINTLALIPDLHPKREALKKYVAELYPKILGAKYESALNKQTQEKRFLYMSRRNDEIRFLDPLMKPFLRDRILATNQYITIKVFSLIKETNKAISVDWHGNKIWLPKSQIKINKKYDNVFSIDVPGWIFRKNLLSIK